MTIGDRFGGALDGAARSFSEALDKGLSPMQFVNEQRKLGKLIPGIGHRVKSVFFLIIFTIFYLTSLDQQPGQACRNSQKVCSRSHQL